MNAVRHITAAEIQNAHAGIAHVVNSDRDNCVRQDYT